MRREQRFEELVAEVGPTVLSYLCRRAQTPDDAADVYQQVLLVAWKKLPAVPRSTDGALPWLLTVARNELNNFRRATVRRSQATVRLAEQLRVATEPAEIDLSEALAALSRDDAELVTLVHWEGLSIASAAQVLGISAAAARKRMERARRDLRAQLARPDDDPAARLRAV